MWTKPSARCALQVPLTKYHDHAVKGMTGVLVPDKAVGEYGKRSRFGCVRLDCCGHELDVLLSQLRVGPVVEEDS